METRDVEKAIPAKVQIIMIAASAKSTAKRSSPFDKEQNAASGLSSSSHLTGWRLWALSFSLCLGIFLSALEMSIVSTSLVSISDEFQDFWRSSWMVSAYILTYTSFLIPLSKLSDVYGRRPLLVSSYVLFIAFSAAAGCSQNTIQLCILRAFQGIGGGGIFSLAFVVLLEMVPPRLNATYSAITSSVFALSSLLGPVLGGFVTAYSTWRWIFWLNIPAGAISLVIIFVALPAHFPKHRMDPAEVKKDRNPGRLDFLGAFLMLAATLLIVVALESGGTLYEWSDAVPLTLLCTGMVCLVAFFAWQKHQAGRTSRRESVLPWRVLCNRFAVGGILNAFFTGAAFVTSVIEIPQRFQVVDGDDPLVAGYRLLSLTLAFPVGAILAGVLMQRFKVPPIYLLFLGGLLQTLGLSLYAGLDARSLVIHPTQYVFDVLAGTGFGLNLNLAVMLMPLVLERRDMAVGIGAANQLRNFGACVGVSSGANILSHQLKYRLADALEPQQLASLLRNPVALDGLKPLARASFREAYSDGFNQQIWLCSAFAICSMLTCLLLIERRPRRMPSKL